MRKLLYLPLLMALIAVVSLSQRAKAQDQPNRMSDRDIKELAQRMDHDADRFRHSLHEEMEHFRWDDKRDRDSMNKTATEFEHATDRLKNHFHDGNARPADIQEVLDRGAEIDGYIMGRHMLPRAKSDWVALRGDLDQLASAYNITWKWQEGPPNDAPPAQPDR
jgi:hypothetical protein